MIRIAPCRGSKSPNKIGVSDEKLLTLPNAARKIPSESSMRWSRFDSFQGDPRTWAPWVANQFVVASQLMSPLASSHQSSVATASVALSCLATWTLVSWRDVNFSGRVHVKTSSIGHADVGTRRDASGRLGWCRRGGIDGAVSVRGRHGHDCRRHLGKLARWLVPGNHGATELRTRSIRWFELLVAHEFRRRHCSASQCTESAAAQWH